MEKEDPCVQNPSETDTLNESGGRVIIDHPSHFGYNGEDCYTRCDSSIEKQLNFYRAKCRRLTCERDKLMRM